MADGPSASWAFDHSFLREFHSFAVATKGKAGGGPTLLVRPGLPRASKS